MMKIFYFTFLFLSVFPQESFSFYREIETINYEGNNYSIRIVKRQPIQIYIFDEENMPVDVSTIDMELFKESDDNEREVPVRLRIIENHFVIADKTTTDQPYRLEIKALNDTKKEAFSVTLQKSIRARRQSLLGSQW